MGAVTRARYALTAAAVFLVSAVSLELYTRGRTYRNKGLVVASGVLWGLCIGVVPAIYSYVGTSHANVLGAVFLVLLVAAIGVSVAVAQLPGNTPGSLDALAVTWGATAAALIYAPAIMIIKLSK